MIEQLLHIALHRLLEEGVKKLTKGSNGTATPKVSENEKKKIDEQKKKIL